MDKNKQTNYTSTYNIIHVCILFISAGEPQTLGKFKICFVRSDAQIFFNHKVTYYCEFMPFTDNTVAHCLKDDS